MSRIFLSHSSKDQKQVEGLAQDLDTAGNVVWFDHKLTGGQAWWGQILEQIRQCDLFMHPRRQKRQARSRRLPSHPHCRFSPKQSLSLKRPST